MEHTDGTEKRIPCGCDCRPGDFLTPQLVRCMRGLALPSNAPPIDANDQWIAAHVPALDAAPITDKTREFSHTPSLIVKGRPSG